jgi:hypothetical protein
MSNNDQLYKVKQKNIKISNRLKDISKDILVLTEQLDFSIEKEKCDNIRPAGRISFVLNPSHLHFTSTLRRW